MHPWHERGAPGLVPRADRIDGTEDGLVIFAVNAEATVWALRAGRLAVPDLLRVVAHDVPHQGRASQAVTLVG
jgi:hypothetical protein